MRVWWLLDYWFMKNLWKLLSDTKVQVPIVLFKFCPKKWKLSKAFTFYVIQNKTNSILRIDNYLSSMSVTYLIQGTWPLVLLLHIVMDYMDHKLVMRNTQFFWKTSYFCGQTGHFTWLVFFCSNEKQCVHKLVLIETTCQIFNALKEQVFHQ